MRALLLVLGAAVFAVALILSSHLLGVDLSAAAAMLDAKTLALLASLYVASEVVRGVRLYLLLKAAARGGLEVEPSLAKSVLARLASNLVSAVTPCVAGGEVVRGVLACSRLGAGVISAGMLDGAYDLFLNYALALLLAPWVIGDGARTAYFAAAATLGFAPVATWSAAVVLGARLPSKLRWMAKKVGVEGALQRAAAAVKASMRLELQVAVAALSVVAWVLQGLQLWVVALRACARPCSPLEAVAGMLVGSLMSVIPSPGGAGVLEVAAASFTCPYAAFAWRLAWLLLIAVFGVPSLTYLVAPFVFRRLRSS